MERPRLKILLRPIDKFIEALGWLCLIALWAVVIYMYPHMPDTIPTHYNFSGQVDSYGSKATIFLLPAIGTIMFVALTILNNYPQVFNYPTNITEENAQFQYTIATRLIRWMKLALLIIFTIISYCSARSMPLGARFLFIFFGLTFVPLFYFIRKALKRK